MEEDKQEITISQGLSWLKSITTRRAELVSLRNENSNSAKRFFGAHGDKETVTTPIYDVKALDKTITLLHMEERKLEDAIKQANATTKIPGYLKDASILGTLE